MYYLSNLQCALELSQVTSAGMVISSARGGTFICKYKEGKTFEYQQSNFLMEYVNSCPVLPFHPCLPLGIYYNFKCLFLCFTTDANTY